MYLQIQEGVLYESDLRPLEIVFYRNGVKLCSGSSIVFFVYLRITL